MSTYSDAFSGSASSDEQLRLLREENSLLREKVERLRGILLTQRESSNHLEDMLDEALDELREAGLLENKFAFPGTRKGRALFDSLPKRFAFDEALERASGMGLAPEEAGKQLEVFFEEDLLRTAPVAQKGKEERHVEGASAEKARGKNASKDYPSVIEKTGLRPWF